MRTTIHPLVLAMGLGLLSTPIVAVNLSTMAAGRDAGGPLITDVGIAAALSAVLLGAVVGGSVGAALLGATRRSVAILLTAMSAWIAAIPGTAIGPAILGKSATLSTACIGGCSDLVRVGEWADLAGAFEATIRSIVLAPFAVAAAPSMTVLELGALIAAIGLTRGAERTTAIIVTRDLCVASLVGLPFAASVFVSGALPSFAALVVGVTFWAARVRPPLSPVGQASAAASPDPAKRGSVPSIHRGWAVGAAIAAAVASLGVAVPYVYWLMDAEPPMDWPYLGSTLSVAVHLLSIPVALGVAGLVAPVARVGFDRLTLLAIGGFVAAVLFVPFASVVGLAALACQAIWLGAQAVVGARWQLARSVAVMAGLLAVLYVVQLLAVFGSGIPTGVPLGMVIPMQVVAALWFGSVAVALSTARRPTGGAASPDQAGAPG